MPTRLPRTREIIIFTFPDPLSGRWLRTARPAILAATASVVVAVGSVGVAHAAEEPPIDFQLPFECEQPWTLNNGAWDHNPALDMARGDDWNETEGSTLLAPADGEIIRSDWNDDPGHVIQISHGDDYYTTHIHLDSRAVEVGDQVSQGDVIGAVGRTGNTSNDTPHLHFELGYDTEDKGYATWGDVGTDRIPGWFDGVEYDAADGTTWEAVESNNCGGGGDPGDPGDPGEPEREATSLSYTGPDAVANGESADLSATLTDGDGDPVADRAVDFALGTGADEQTCEGTTDADGSAACTIDEVDQPVGDEGTVPVSVSFAGDDDYEPSTASEDLRITLETELEYTGTGTVANDTAAELSGTLTDETGAAVGDQAVGFTLGSGESAQTCEGTTDADGGAACTIDSVDQALNDDSTVPVTLAFDGDGFYEASEASAEVLLEHVSGSAFGLSADVPLLGLPISLGPVPETGEVRTERAGTVAPDCAQSVDSLLVSADVLCAEVESVTAPTGVTSSASVSEASIGIAGIPAVGVSGVEVSSTSTCDGQSGSVDLTLTVAGTPVEVGDAPNVDVDLDGLAGTRLVVNEQIEEEDGSLTVNGVHLTGPGGIDVVVGSANSAAHNCA